MSLSWTLNLSRCKICFIVPSHLTFIDQQKENEQFSPPRILQLTSLPWSVWSMIKKAVTPNRKKRSRTWLLTFNWFTETWRREGCESFRQVENKMCSICSSIPDTSSLSNIKCQQRWIGLGHINLWEGRVEAWSEHVIITTVPERQPENHSSSPFLPSLLPWDVPGGARMLHMGGQLA